MKLHWCDTRCRCCQYYRQWVKEHTQSFKWGLTLWQNIIRMKFPMLISLIILKSTADLNVYSIYVLLSPLSTLLAVNVWNLEEMSSIKCFLKSFFLFVFWFVQWASSEGTKPATEHVFCFRALSDIYESIKELQFYKSSIFKVSAEAPLSKIVENGGSNNC